MQTCSASTSIASEIETQPSAQAQPFTQAQSSSQLIELRPPIGGPSGSNRSSPNFANHASSTTPNTMQQNSELPSSTSSVPSLNAPTVKDQAKLETFFQLTGTTAPINLNNPSNKADGASASVSTATDSSQHKRSTSNFMWHVLDNLGVPISKGNHDPDIDPRITEKMAMPKYKNTATLTGDTSRNESPFAPPDQTTRPVVNKIPESELQGMDPVLQNDERTK